MTFKFLLKAYSILNDNIFRLQFYEIENPNPKNKDIKYIA